MPLVDLGAGLGSLREAVLTGHPSPQAAILTSPEEEGLHAGLGSPQPAWQTRPRLRGQVTAACLCHFVQRLCSWQPG